MNYPDLGTYNGKFTNGDPLNEVPASSLSADHMNAVYDELLSIINAAGIAPNQANTAQVLEAIQALHTFDNLQGKQAGTSTYATKGHFQAGLESGTVSMEDSLGNYLLSLAFNCPNGRAGINGSSARLISSSLSNNGNLSVWLGDYKNAGEVVDSKWVLNMSTSYIESTVPMKVTERLSGANPEDPEIVHTVPVAQGDFAGSIHFFATDTTPAGFLKADGSYVSRYNYPRLYEVLGARFGWLDDGSEQFGLPDLRNEFIRGWNGLEGEDSNIGVTQNDEIRSHDHATDGTNGGYKHLVNKNSGRFDVLSSTPDANAEDADYVTGSVTGLYGGTETRPRNIALAAYIKY